MNSNENRPTPATYHQLQTAYDWFNENLFEQALPDCLITLQRKSRAMGYYSPQRWTNAHGEKTDEIALNPAYFANHSLKELLQTLVHEMCHQWQQHFGKPSRNGYHNRQWADKMESVGLMPSSTGETRRCQGPASIWAITRSRMVNSSCSHGDLSSAILNCRGWIVLFRIHLPPRTACNTKPHLRLTEKGRHWISASSIYSPSSMSSLTVLPNGPAINKNAKPPMNARVAHPGYGAGQSCHSPAWTAMRSTRPFSDAFLTQQSIPLSASGAVI